MTDTNNKYGFLDYTGLVSLWNNIKKIIEDNELVMATALTDLDTRVDNLEGLTPPIISKTYSELKTLRDNSNLVPGMQYRITDYVTTVLTENTQVAGHQFDLIVTADDESTLNEKARAIQHEGDTYFANSNLAAWEIKYCLDNDRDRFAWAVTKGRIIVVDVSDIADGVSLTAVLNGTFVYNNTTYARWDVVSQSIGITTYILTPSEDVTIGSTPIVYNVDYSQGTEIGTIASVTINESDGKGVIYRMIDEFNNDVPYDFKNIQFLRKITDGALDLEHGTDTYCYTFSDFSSGVLLDDSFAASVSNTFGTNCWDNVFLGNNCYNNSFGNDCYNNSFGNNCYSNSFGNECYSNSFGNNCLSNSFGNYCRNNSFGYGCSYNSFGEDCVTISFGEGCARNSFGNNCYIISFGNDCQSNSFGNRCYNNSFGNGCYNNSFGNEYVSNSFGYGCSHNSFGDSCSNNSFGNGCVANSFGNACGNNSFRMSESIDGTLKSYCSYNHFDDGCSYNIIWNADTTISKLQNINVNRGVSGTIGEYNYINITTLNQNYEIMVSKNSNGEIKIYCSTDLITEKADKSYVDNAIASAITNTLNTEV